MSILYISESLLSIANQMNLMKLWIFICFCFHIVMTPMLRPPGGPPTGGPPPMRPMGPPPGMMHGNITHVLFIRFSMYLFVSDVDKN